MLTYADVCCRLQELFRPGYGQWFEGVFQAHTFLLGLHARGEHAKVF
jgi:hypothetical protein